MTAPLASARAWRHGSLGRVWARNRAAPVDGLGCGRDPLCDIVGLGLTLLHAWMVLVAAQVQ